MPLDTLGFSMRHIYFFICFAREPKHDTGTREAWQWIFERHWRIIVGARWKRRGNEEPSSRQTIFLQAPQDNMHWCDQLKPQQQTQTMGQWKTRPRKAGNKETIQINALWMLRATTLQEQRPGRIKQAEHQAPRETKKTTNMRKTSSPRLERTSGTNWMKPQCHTKWWWTTTHCGRNTTISCRPC